jgi:glycosyltransferase involved in cell wall biosynthesis
MAGSSANKAPCRILILTARMSRGFGVDVIVGIHAEHFTKQGNKVLIGCLDGDSSYSHLNIIYIAPEIKSLQYLIDQFKPDIIFAHTSPFFELLPNFVNECQCWAIEYGEPTPSLFPKEFERRTAIKNFKLNNVYPVIHGVVCISDFIKRDIEWPKSLVISFGHEHLGAIGTDHFPKPVNELMPKGILRVGTLMRLGEGESFYKGNTSFLKLVKEIQSHKLSIEFYFLGRGTEELAKPFLDVGVKVHLNASQKERNDYLRNLDVFISLSQWEGFNLPLMEAQTSGTVALALNVGAHPEVTPLVFDTVHEIQNKIIFYSQNREILLKDSLKCQQHVKSRFRWADNLNQLSRLLPPGRSSTQGLSIGIWARFILKFLRISWVLKNYSPKSLVRIIKRKMFLN